MKLLLYCTKAKPYLVKRNILTGVEPAYFTLKENVEDKLNGKIVAECDFEVEEIKTYLDDYYYTEKLGGFTLQYKSCLNANELDDYLQEKNGYAIHIKNLHIFDEPKELEYFESYKDDNYNVIEKAPQNMMYAYYITKIYADTVYQKPYIRYTYDKYILISIKPEWLCKILNGEKTIEVRKKVLKEMLK